MSGFYEMKIIQYFLMTLFVLLSMLLGFWLVSENEVQVSLVLLGFTLSESSLGVVVALTFSSGILLGLFANIIPNSLLLLKIRRLTKKNLKITASAKNSATE